MGAPLAKFNERYQVCNQAHKKMVSKVYRSKNGNEFGNRENFIRRENLKSANNICPRLHLANENEPRILYIDTHSPIHSGYSGFKKSYYTIGRFSATLSAPAQPCNRGHKALGKVQLRHLGRLQVSQPNRPAIMARLKSNMEEHPAGKNRMKDTFHPREIVA
jgi:hypothetical protein